MFISHLFPSSFLVKNEKIPCSKSPRGNHWYFEVHTYLEILTFILSLRSYYMFTIQHLSIFRELFTTLPFLRFVANEYQIRGYKQLYWLYFSYPSIGPILREH